MDRRALAGSIAVLGRAMVAASLFFVLIWWRISAYLLLAGAALLGLAWLMDLADHAVRPALPTTVQE